MISNVVVRLVVVSLFALPQLQFAQSAKVDPGAKQAINPDCATVKFHSLKRYKGEKWALVFKDAEVAPVLKILLKKNYSKLTENLSQVTYPDSLSFVDQQGILTLQGFVQGLATISEAILIVEPCGNVYATILDDGERFLYYTNDGKYVGSLPPIIAAWKNQIEKSRSQTTKEPELPVVFMSK
jgi:hypothetical protein